MAFVSTDCRRRLAGQVSRLVSIAVRIGRMRLDGARAYAALVAWHQILNRLRERRPGPDELEGTIGAAIEPRVSILVGPPTSSGLLGGGFIGQPIEAGHG